jgi:cobalamin biosynthesis protein CobW
LVIQGVGKRFEQFYDRLWRVDEARETKLVFIGQSSADALEPKFDAKSIESQLLQLVE